MGVGLWLGLKTKKWDFKKEKRKRMESGRRELLVTVRRSFSIGSLAGRLDGRTSSVPHENLRKCSTRREERFSMTDLDFNGLICRYVVGKSNPKTLFKCFNH